jgi:hypothetical protein
MFQVLVHFFAINFRVPDLRPEIASYILNKENFDYLKPSIQRTTGFNDDSTEIWE